jgi:DNA-binding Lrp family transcriptional regulator
MRNNLRRTSLKVRILRLATLRSTGRPAEIAGMLAISERSVKRIVKEIRDEGTLIRFSQARQSYITGDE